MTLVALAPAVGGNANAKIAEIAKIKTKRRRRECEERLLSIGSPCRSLFTNAD
jgi:hypothetical protein